jgi:hypothetical protein
MFENFKDKKQNNSVIEMTIKKRKILISSEIKAKSFISVDFCKEKDKLLVTLGDDGSVIIWQFDK